MSATLVSTFKQSNTRKEGVQVNTRNASLPAVLGGERRGGRGYVTAGSLAAVLLIGERGLFHKRGPE